MYSVTRLSNGLTVATASQPHMASVSVGLWLAVGGRCEPESLNGVSHFIEHMLFKGTRRRTAREISEAVEGLGGYLNAFTSEEHTCFYARACADRYELLLEVLMDMFLHSVFDPRELAKERAVIKEELAMYADQPHQQVQELLNATLWPDHPLGRPLTGTEKSLDAITRRRMLAYRKIHYVAPAAVLAVAGNVSHRRVLRAARRYARAFPSGTRTGFAPTHRVQSRPEVRLITKATTQAALAVGIRACSRHDDRRFALRVLCVLLGESMSSRLFQSIREDRGLAYSIQSSLSLFEDVGEMEIGAGLDTDRLPQVLRLIMTEVRRCREKPPSVAELRKARDYLIGQLELGMESTENRMMWLGEDLLSYGRPIPAAELIRRWQAVTAQEVMAVARAYFRPERTCLALVSPLRRVPFAAKLLSM